MLEKRHSLWRRTGPGNGYAGSASPAVAATGVSIASSKPACNSATACSLNNPSRARPSNAARWARNTSCRVRVRICSLISGWLSSKSRRAAFKLSSRRSSSPLTVSQANGSNTPSWYKLSRWRPAERVANNSPRMRSYCNEVVVLAVKPSRCSRDEIVVAWANSVKSTTANAMACNCPRAANSSGKLSAKAKLTAPRRPPHIITCR